MRSSEPFTEVEALDLVRRLAAGRPLVCPRCAVPLERRAVRPRSDVSYVRDRVWVVCSSCRRTAVLDPREHP